MAIVLACFRAVAGVGAGVRGAGKNGNGIIFVTRAAHNALLLPLLHIKHMRQYGQCFFMREQPRAVGLVVARKRQLAVVHQGSNLGIFQCIDLHTGRHMLRRTHHVRNGTRHRHIAFGVVQRGQPQRSKQHPAHAHATSRQNHAFPDGRAQAHGTPAHQCPPSQRSEQTQQKHAPLKARRKAFKHAIHTRGRALGHASNSSNPDKPDVAASQRKQNQRKPVYKSTHAASECGQGKGSQGGVSGEREQQQSIVSVGEERAQRADKNHA